MIREGFLICQKCKNGEISALNSDIWVCDNCGDRWIVDRSYLKVYAKCTQCHRTSFFKDACVICPGVYEREPFYSDGTKYQEVINESFY